MTKPNLYGFEHDTYFFTVIVHLELLMKWNSQKMPI
jgi:hypothetical protein